MTRGGPETSVPNPAQAAERKAKELLTSGSLEIGAHRPEDARRVSELLPAGTPVFVNHLPRHRLEDTLAGLKAVRAAGLEPVPHIAARRVVSAGELDEFLKRAVGEIGVRKALVIGGDVGAAAGPFADALGLIVTGTLSRRGLKEIAIATYPEGHPRIANPGLEAAFTDKVAALKAQGLGVSAVSQFTFAPHRVLELAARLARQHPDVPLYVGLAGPTSPTRLIAYAQRCGVSASLRALGTQGMAAVRLITHTDPSEQLIAIARHCASGAAPNIVGAHIFTFGGVDKAAEFMNRWIRSGSSVVSATDGEGTATSRPFVTQSQN